MSGFSLSWIRSGSEAQLNGELSRDFTSSFRAELLGLLNQRQLDDDTLLASLLVSTDEEIVLLALETLASRARSHHLVLDERTSRMVSELSRGWPHFDLLSCVSGESGTLGLSMLDLGNITEEESCCLGLFNRLVCKQDVPGESRFGLLTRIRFARGFSSTETRHAYVKIMILAMQLQWERKLMRRQLRKLVRSGRVPIPGSIRVLALETLTVYGKARVFSPADRERRVEDFLSGKTVDSSFVEAMLRNSAPVKVRAHHHHRELPGFIISSAITGNVLNWLEVESVERSGERSGDEQKEVVERLLLSPGLENLQRGEDTARLQHCLLGLFRNSELFGARVFNLAASFFISRPGKRELEKAFMAAMISVAIPLGWQVTNQEAIAFFFSHLTQKVKRNTIDLIIKDVDAHSGSLLLRHALMKHPRFTSSLLDAGGYEFIRRIPPGLLDLPEKPERPMFDVNDEIARSFCRDLGSCSSEDRELLRHLEWMMRVGGDVFLRQLAAQEGLEKVFEALSWPLTDVCWSILKQMVESLEFPDFKARLDSVIRVHGARFFLEESNSPGCLSVIWRHAGSDERRRVLASLLPDECIAGEQELATRVFMQLVSSLEDLKPDPGLGSRVFQMLRASSSNASATKELLLILSHVVKVSYRESDDLFAPRGQENDDSTRIFRVEALAWYRASLVTGACFPELLELGEALTRDTELARELLGTWELPQLVDKLLEVAGDDPRARRFAALTLVHLLEDDEVLYHSMAYKIPAFVSTGCRLDHFFSGLSSLAFRDPAIFLRASFDTCEFSCEVRLKPREHYRALMLGNPVFGKLFDHILSRLDDSTLELLTTMLVELPVSLQAAIDAGAVERVLEGSFASELGPSRFMDVLEKHSRHHVIARAMLNVFSSPDPGTTRMINMLKRLPRCGRYVTSPEVFDRIVKGLSLIDPDHHPEVAVSVSRMLLLVGDRFVDYIGDHRVSPSFPGPMVVSGASVETFRSLLEQMQGCSPRRSYTVLRMEEPMNLVDWDPTDEHIGTLSKLFRLDPGTRSHALLGKLFRSEYNVKSPASVLSVLVHALLRPGPPHHPTRGPGLWACHTSTITGVPEFVLARLFHLHWRLFRIRDKGLTFDEGASLELIPLLVGAVRSKVLRRVAGCLLEAIVLQLAEKRHQETYSVSVSPEELRGFCHLAIHTSDRLSNALVSLVSLDPTLASPLLSSMMGLSGEITRSALELLENGDYSTGGAVVLRFVRVLEGLGDAIQPVSEVARALAPLWRFILHGKARIEKKMHLIQAFVIALKLSTEDSTPSEPAMEILRSIVRIPQLAKLSLPMLQRWQLLESVDFPRKLEFLRSSIAASSLEAEKIHISRDNILRDSYRELGRFSPQFLKNSGNISVDFVGEQGSDGGGLRREWYQVLSRAIGKELFNDVGNPSSSSELDISYFRFAGRLVAKAIVDDERINLRFSPSFYKHLLGQEVTYRDIEDPEYLRSLNWLLENDVDESMGLTFSADIEVSPLIVTHELVAGGSDIPVTNANKHQFVKLLGDYLLTKSFELELDAFLDGFYKVIPKRLISMFLPAELELILCGLHEINVAELKTIAECDHTDQIVQWFWDIVADFDHEKKTLLLKFITGSSKIPYGGIKMFSVRSMDAKEHLPSSHTCTNVIIIPRCETKLQLEHKLLLAIQEERFELG